MGIEIASSFSTSHRQSRQTIFEDLFEAEEFQDAQIYTVMKSQSSFVRSDGAIKLYSISSIDLDLSLIVYSGHSKHDRPFRFDDPF